MALVVLLVTAAVSPAAVAATQAETSVAATESDTVEKATQSDGYAGANVTFETSSDAVVDYAVDGEVVVSSVQTESKSSYESRVGVGVGLDLSAVADLQAAAVSMAARAETSATVGTESGAELTAHDNDHGILVVEASEDHLVRADVEADAEARAESENRVVVETGDGAEGTFLVVGDGSVAVNDEGDVVAEVGADGKLVFRAYVGDQRTDEDEAHERLIANGTAAAEVHVLDREGGTESDDVAYDDDTSATVTRSAEGTVEVVVERAEHDGKVVITQVSEAAIGSAEDLQVRVDGEAAVRASTYAELASAADGGETSKYMVRQRGSAEGSVQVLVALNHFSERTVTMTDDSTSTPTPDDGTPADGDDGTSSDGDEETATDADDGSDAGDDTPTDDGSSEGAPGFGAVVALIALVAAAVVATRRR